MKIDYATAAATVISNIRTISVVTTYTDDHITCVVVDINGSRFDWRWCGDEVVAGIRYYHESNNAKQLVAQYLEHYFIEQMVDAIVDNDCTDSFDEAVCMLVLAGIRPHSIKQRQQ
jgi:hypothetical protein